MSRTVEKLLTRVSQRSNTSVGWTVANPVLLAGEMGMEIDTHRVKHGDGIHTWNELPYWTNGDVTYTQGDGVIITSREISATLLYELLRMPNVRIYCHDPNDYPVRLAISTSDGYKVYTDE